MRNDWEDGAAENAAGGVSRRAFVGGGALAAAAALFGASGFAVTGCTPTQEATGNLAETGEGDGSTVPFDVFDADVLIIGGGNNAIAAAVAAMAEGRNVLMVDKGPFAHSGTSGMGWDSFTWLLTKDMIYEGDDSIKGLAGFKPGCNQKAVKNAIDTDPRENKKVFMVNTGQTICDREADGTVKPFMFPFGFQSQFVRRGCDYVNEAPRASVMDRTMVTDFLVQDGRCVGVVGVHLPTGRYRVCRAKATIMASGSSTWMFGWLTVSARSNSTTDSTGDLAAAAFRRGLGVANSEFASYDALTVAPSGIGYGFGAGLTADPGEALYVTDINGEHVFSEDHPAVVDASWTDFAIGVAETIADGRGTENGGVYVSIGDAQLRPENERNVELFRRFGVDPRTEPVEVSIEMFEHGGTPVTDEKLMTELPGLFNGRSLPEGAGVYMNHVFGEYAGRMAAEYAATAPALTDVDVSSALEEIARLEDLRTRQVENPLRPHEVRHAIQNATYNAMGVLRTEEALAATNAELERIRREDMPRMQVTDASPAYNIEWKHAIENFNLLDAAEMSVKATLAREESSNGYIREGFPEADPENWSCLLVCYDRDGQMEFDKVPYETVEWE